MLKNKKGSATIQYILVTLLVAIVAGIAFLFVSNTTSENASSSISTVQSEDACMLARGVWNSETQTCNSDNSVVDNKEETTPTPSKETTYIGCGDNPVFYSSIQNALRAGEQNIFKVSSVNSKVDYTKQYCRYVEPENVSSFLEYFPAKEGELMLEAFGDAIIRPDYDYNDSSIGVIKGYTKLYVANLISLYYHKGFYSNYYQKNLEYILLDLDFSSSSTYYNNSVTVNVLTSHVLNSINCIIPSTKILIPQKGQVYKRYDPYDYDYEVQTGTIVDFGCYGNLTDDNKYETKINTYQRTYFARYPKGCYISTGDILSSYAQYPILQMEDGTYDGIDIGRSFSQKNITFTLQNPKESDYIYITKEHYNIDIPQLLSSIPSTKTYYKTYSSLIDNNGANSSHIDYFTEKYDAK